MIRVGGVLGFSPMQIGSVGDLSVALIQARTETETLHYIHTHSTELQREKKDKSFNQAKINP